MGRGPKTKLTEAVKKQIVRFGKEGYYIHEIAKKIGVRRETLQVWLSENKELSNIYLDTLTEEGLISRAMREESKAIRLIEERKKTYETHSQFGSTERIDPASLKEVEIILRASESTRQYISTIRMAQKAARAVEKAAGQEVEDKEINLNLIIDDRRKS